MRLLFWVLLFISGGFSNWSQLAVLKITRQLLYHCSSLFGLRLETERLPEPWKRSSRYLQKEQCLLWTTNRPSWLETAELCSFCWRRLRSWLVVSQFRHSRLYKGTWGPDWDSYVTRPSGWPPWGVSCPPTSFLETAWSGRELDGTLRLGRTRTTYKLSLMA